MHEKSQHIVAWRGQITWATHTHRHAHIHYIQIQRYISIDQIRMPKTYASGDGHVPRRRTGALMRWSCHWR